MKNPEGGGSDPHQPSSRTVHAFGHEKVKRNTAEYFFLLKKTAANRNIIIINDKHLLTMKI